MGSPYITPAILSSAGQFGISWNTIPQPGSTAAQQLAEQTNICNRASSEADGIAGQNLRATVNQEMILGPGFRANSISGSSTWRLLTSQHPIIKVVSAQYAPNNPPFAWNAIPAGAVVPEQPPWGEFGTTSPFNATGGQNVLLAGNMPYGFPRNGLAIQVVYVNGWPHCATTQNVIQGATTVTVDDVTGFTGAQAKANDGALTETITVLSVVANTPGLAEPSGPGTIALATGFVNAHSNGIIITAIPEAIQKAVLYLAASEALTRSATALSVPAMKGGATGAGGSKGSLIENWHNKAQELLRPFRRLV